MKHFHIDMHLYDNRAEVQMWELRFLHFRDACSSRSSADVDPDERVLTDWGHISRAHQENLKDFRFMIPKDVFEFSRMWKQLTGLKNAALKKSLARMAAKHAACGRLCCATPSFEKDKSKAYRSKILETYQAQCLECGAQLSYKPPPNIHNPRTNKNKGRLQNR